MLPSSGLHFSLAIHENGSQKHSDCRIANSSFFSIYPSHSMDGYANTGPPPPPPAPLIPSAQTAFASPPGGPMSPGPMVGMGGYAPPPPALSGAHAAPPPPGPPPPPLPAGASHLTTRKMSSSTPAEATVVNDARSDLLAAIRMGEDACTLLRPCRGCAVKWLMSFMIFLQASS